MTYDAEKVHALGWGASRLLISADDVGGVLAGHHVLVYDTKLRVAWCCLGVLFDE